MIPVIAARVSGACGGAGCPHPGDRMPFAPGASRWLRPAERYSSGTRRFTCPIPPMRPVFACGRKRRLGGRGCRGPRRRLLLSRPCSGRGRWLGTRPSRPWQLAARQELLKIKCAVRTLRPLTGVAAVWRRPGRPGGSLVARRLSTLTVVCCGERGGIRSLGSCRLLARLTVVRGGRCARRGRALAGGSALSGAGAPEQVEVLCARRAPISQRRYSAATSTARAQRAHPFLGCSPGLLVLARTRLTPRRFYRIAVARELGGRSIT